MKTRSGIKAGGHFMNHNQSPHTRTGVKAGGLRLNHNQAR